jgi:hypothetical protein
MWLRQMAQLSTTISARAQRRLIADQIASNLSHLIITKKESAIYRRAHRTPCPERDGVPLLDLEALVELAGGGRAGGGGALAGGSRGRRRVDVGLHEGHRGRSLGFWKEGDGRVGLESQFYASARGPMLSRYVVTVCNENFNSYRSRKLFVFYVKNCAFKSLFCESLDVGNVQIFWHIFQFQ